jgi:phosphoglycerate dehydrogenase-like enzyme
MKNKIVVVKNLHLYPDQVERLKELGDVEFFAEPPANPDEWLERCQGATIICSGIFACNTEKLYELSNVFISLPLVGVDYIDAERAREKRIVVANAPGCNREAVAEWIIGVLLMHFRRLSLLSRNTEIQISEAIETGTALFDKKISILGAGNIGMHLSSICKGFGMRVTVFRRGNDLLECVRDADIVANCLSAKPDTSNLLDSQFFCSLKKDSFFVSVGRPQTYDLEALKSALDEGILSGAADDAAGAAIGDVTDSNYQALVEHPKILVTPHIAWSTDSEIRKSNDIMIDNIAAWLNKKPINLVV